MNQLDALATLWKFRQITHINGFYWVSAVHYRFLDYDLVALTCSKPVIICK